MNRRRKLLAVIAGVPVLLVLLVLLAAVVLPLLVDSSYYRGNVVALVKAQTGRELHIDGAVRLRLLPEPSLTVTGVRLGNPPGFAGSDIARLSALAVELKLWPLFQGRLATRSLEVRGLELNLERNGRGRGNWEGLSGIGQSTGASERRVVDALPAAMVVDGLHIRDAIINWRDPATGTMTTIANIDLQTGAFHVGKGFDDLRVRATLPGDASRGAPATIEVRGDVELTAAGGTLAVPNLTATVADLVIAGLRIDAGLETQLGADFEQQRFTLDALRVSAEASDGEDARATLEISTTLEFDFSRQRLAETTLSVKVPAYSVSGVDGELELVAMVGGDLSAGTYTLNAIRSHGTVGGGGDPDNGQAFRFTADVNLDASKRALTAKRLQLSATDVHASGELTLKAVQAGMEGVFDLAVIDQQLNGNFTIAESTAGFDLRIDLRADLDIGDGRYALRGRNDIDLRATVSRAPADERYRVADLQVNAQLADPSFPDGRLPVKLRADLDVDLNSETIRTNNLRLDVDESRIAGSVEIRHFAAPVVRFDLEADAIDADRLLPPTNSSATGRVAPVGATIAAIRALDLDGEIRVETLTLEGLQMSNVRLTSRGGTVNR